MEIEEELTENPRQISIQQDAEPKDVHKIFVVHGHDQGSKEAVARYLGKLGLQPIVLHELPDQGRTIIEKFEHHADVGCALVILSPDDVGFEKNNTSVQEGRARQNVIFEMGFFVGRLGRKNTFVLLQKGVTRPSDIDGVLYISMDDDATWRMRLVGELKAAGMDVDANKAFG
jgi:predicted nucleotide-binding protein